MVIRKNKNGKEGRALLLIRLFLRLVLAGGLAVIISVAVLFYSLSPQLPDIQTLKEIKLQVPLKVYSQDGLLIAQFGEKKRTPVSIEETPQKLIDAFLSAEDDRFYQHPGVDYHGLIRAAVQLVISGKKRQGGSTITMQVARNFFLSNEKTFTRKFKEIFLALKIENALSKAEILELYLNKIYLGHRSYGIGAAAQTYYGASVDQLTLAQLAMVAGLPKAPSRFNPVTNPERALTRRNYVLGRMKQLRYITEAEHNVALKQPVTAKLHRSEIEIEASHLAEMVRAEMIRRFGDQAYMGGYSVVTTLSSRRQKSANAALRNTVHAYDKRHGYRETPTTFPGFSPETPLTELDEQLSRRPHVKGTQSAIVTFVDDKAIEVYLGKSISSMINWKGLEWARKYIRTNRRGKPIKKAADILSVGDLIQVRRTVHGGWELSQTPEVEAAFVSLNPQTGAIQALVGGYAFSKSKYNRAIQSKRQPGSGFKPILYTTALDNGYTLATLINDAPVVFDDPALESEWRPENYSGKFFGPTRLRVALRKSRNLVSIRILRDLGVKKVIDYATRFGLSEEQLPRNLSLALGSGNATPLDMARVFSVFANGGFLITPFFIDEIKDSDGVILFKATPEIVCADCKEPPAILTAPFEESETLPTNYAKRIISPEIHFLMNSLLQDVVKRGTARRARVLGRQDIAGKTGTTNDQRDAWFNGYNPNLVAVAWVGFDSSQPLGSRETGGRAALPMWIDYMKQALADMPEVLFEQPEGITSILIDPITGLLAGPDSNNGIFELFRIENSPTEMAVDESQDSMISPEVGGDNDDSLF